MLAEFRLIPGLNNLFDKLIWRKYTASNHVVHGQNENCDCSPVWHSLQASSKQLNETFSSLTQPLTFFLFSLCRKYPSKSSSCGYFRVSVITMSKWPLIQFPWIWLLLVSYVKLKPFACLSGTNTSCWIARSWMNWVPYPWRLTSLRWKLWSTQTEALCVMGRRVSSHASSLSWRGSLQTHPSGQHYVGQSSRHRRYRCWYFSRLRLIERAKHPHTRAPGSLLPSFKIVS